MTLLTFTSGMTLLRARDYEAVYAQSIAALKLNEKNPLPFFLLGVLASDTGSHGKALELFAKASEHGPKNAHYQTYYAKALGGFGHNEQAKIHADKAAAIGTNEALLADMVGVVYSRVGYHELAIPFFEQATKRNPRWAKFHFNLGASAEFIGDFKTAKTAYQKAVSLDPKFYLAWFSLTSLEEQSPDNNKLEKLTSLFEGAVGDADAQLLLGHSIAKTLEDLERYEESFDWLKQAKRLKKEQARYSRQEVAKVFEAAKSIAVKSGPNKETASTATPIFIVGLPRTGTTLIDRILSSHAEVRSAGELNVFPELIKRATGMPLNMEFQAQAFLAAGKIDLSHVGETYVNKTKDLTFGAAYLVDKLPFNFFYAGLIHRALPNAKIIALRRGAMDSCLSNYRQLFAFHNHNHGYSLDIQDTAHFYREFDGLMTHWRSTLPPGRFMEIAYEDIISDQENQTRKLLSFCGLEWDEACLRFHENTAPVSTASAVQVRRPLHSKSIGRWKKYGDKLDELRAALAS